MGARIRRGCTFCVSLMIGTAVLGPAATAAEPASKADFRGEFIYLCDTACRELNSEAREDSFYRDSYAVRALLAAYDLTGKQAYFDTCKRWSDRMVEYQSQMIPKNAYYMNYCRKPGQEKGDWYVADSSSIAMGVLATAVRCSDPQDRQRYVDSVRRFAQLVIDNYIGPESGVRPGLWRAFDGQWWCSTGIFGSLAFLLYYETGDETCAKAAYGALDWLTRMDFQHVDGPISFEERSPTVVMYILETCSVVLPHLKAGSPRQKAVLEQLHKTLKWMSENQRGRVPSLTWDYNSHKFGVKFGGLPFHMYVNARYVADPAGLRAAADEEMRYIVSVLWKDGPPSITQLAVFTMMSYAERESPGAVYRVSKR